MINKEIPSMPKNELQKKRLLIVGPLPPPMGGSSVTVQAIVDYLRDHPSIQASVLNTSPTRDIRKKMTGFNLEKLWRMVSIPLQFLGKIRQYDAVVIFANNLFAVTLVPALLALAKIFRKPLFLKPVGGDLDLFIKSKNKALQKLFLIVLKSANGILAQTRLLQDALIDLGCKNTHLMPGFRPFTENKKSNHRDDNEFRLIFLAHINRVKGPLVLLEALQQLEKTKPDKIKIQCDFYGPVHYEIEEEFFRQLENTRCAAYCGVAEPGTGTKLIGNYDALVLPTNFICEGHTGVLIEAMHAGVPMISTQHRAIPELITHGQNGLLVPVHDSRALAEAIQEMSLDPSMCERMGKANFERGNEYRSEKVIKGMLEVIFPGHAEINK